MAILTAAKQHFVDLWMGTSLIINDLGDLIYCSSLKWCKYNVSAETGILEVHLLYLLIPQPCPGTFLEGRGCLQPYRPGEQQVLSTGGFKVAVARCVHKEAALPHTLLQLPVERETQGKSCGTCPQKHPKVCVPFLHPSYTLQPRRTPSSVKSSH